MLLGPSQTLRGRLGKQLVLEMLPAVAGLGNFPVGWQVGARRGTPCQCHSIRRSPGASAAAAAPGSSRLVVLSVPLLRDTGHIFQKHLNSSGACMPLAVLMMPTVVQTSHSAGDGPRDPSRLQSPLFLLPLMRKARQRSLWLQQLHQAVRCQGPVCLHFLHQHDLHLLNVFQHLSNSDN